MTNGRRVSILICIALALVTFIIFWPQKHFEFLSLDDPDYVTSNSYVKEGLTWNGLIWSLTAVHAQNWHPLTWISHMADCQFFGLNPKEAHLVNLFFHAVNTILLFLLLHSLTRAQWRSAVVAGLFALHPLRVESVAWVAERKDVLSAFFFLLTIWTFTRFALEAGSKNKRPKLYYGAALFFFCLGLTSKPMLVTLPFILLLLDFWPLKRLSASSILRPDPKLRALLLEKIPFFVLSFVVSAITFLAQKEAREATPESNFSMRIANAIISYARYLGKTIWPTKLSVLYPYPNHWPWVQIFLAAILVVAVTVVAVRTARSWPFLPVGWFWFLGMLVPVIGLVQVGEQSMADRYTYLPSIGIFIIVVWGGIELINRFHIPKIIATVSVSLILVSLAICTRQQLKYWRNSELLFNHAIEVTKDNYPMYVDLGSVLVEQGRIDEATNCFYKAIQINPGYTHAYNSLGTTFVKLGKPAEAENFFEKTLRINPSDAEALNNLGVISARQGDLSGAEKKLKQSVQIRPDYPDAFNNLGQVVGAQGRQDEAINCYRAVLKIDPYFQGARNNLAVQLARKGQYEEAASYCQQELKLNSNQPRAHLTLGNIFVAMGRRNEAITQFTEALRLDPGLSEARNQLTALGINPDTTH